jgi:hypothetical protein
MFVKVAGGIVASVVLLITANGPAGTNMAEGFAANDYNTKTMNGSFG